MSPFWDWTSKAVLEGDTTIRERVYDLWSYAVSCISPIKQKLVNCTLSFLCKCTTALRMYICRLEIFVWNFYWKKATKLAPITSTENRPNNLYCLVSWSFLRQLRVQPCLISPKSASRKPLTKCSCTVL